MKRITLLSVGAILATSLYAQTELNGIKISEGNDYSQYHYYRIRNMRAMRQDFTNGVISNMHGDSIGCDTNGFYMSETLPDGTPTPKIADHPYMGLANLGGNWWLSFSRDEEYTQAPETEYWYFTADSKYPGKLKIHNVAITGSISPETKPATDNAGYSRFNVDYNQRHNFWYVLPVKPAFEAMNSETVSWTDSILQYLTEDDFNRAYAFSLKDTLSDQPGYANQCIEVTNKARIKHREPMLAENGDTLTYENGNPMFYRYGFAATDIAGSPVATSPDNRYHWQNNGAIFILEPAETADALAAKQEFENWTYHHCPDPSHIAPISEAMYRINAWKNLPALYSDQALAKLNEIYNWLENFYKEQEASDISSTITAENLQTYIDYVDSIQSITDGKLNEAAALIGTGCIVRFQNQLSIKDLRQYLDNSPEQNEALQLGNAYIAAGGDPSYRTDGAIWYMSDDENFAEFMNTGIEPRLQADANCQWELIPVENSYYFLLYNEATNSYIRKYHDLYDYYGGEENLLIKEGSIQDFSWTTTTNRNDAAPFTFIGCANPNEQTQIYDYQKPLFAAAGLDTNIENKVRLQANYVYSVDNPITGKSETLSYTHHIHRGSSKSGYRFIQWGNTYNNWFADSNAFLIETVQMGGIEEVAATKPAAATGIYDLQGRRVTNPRRGLYIQNGRKVIKK